MDTDIKVKRAPNAWDNILSPGREVAELWFKDGGKVEDIQILEVSEESDFIAYMDTDVTDQSLIIVQHFSEVKSVKLSVDMPNPWLPTDYVERLAKEFG